MNAVRITIVAILATGLLMCVPLSSDAGLITPISVTSSTSSTDYYPAAYLINNSGLSTPIGVSSVHAAVDGANSWVTTSTGAPYSGPRPILTFGLDQTYFLTDVVVWNYAMASNDNSAKSITVDFSTNGIAGPFSGGVIITVPYGIGANTPGSVLSLGGVYLANAVRFTVNTNWYYTFGGGDRMGLSEVKFSVPEPSSVLLGALGLLGLVPTAIGRTRRRSCKLQRNAAGPPITVCPSRPQPLGGAAGAPP